MKRVFNEKYFSEIDSEEKAYWLGFLYADGYLSDRKVSCFLSKKDEDHLIKFLSSIESEGIKMLYINKTNACGFTLTSETMFCDLQRLGFTQRKTYDDTDYIFTQIPEQYKKDFIRGFWDGDGTVRLREGRYNTISVVSLNNSLLNAFCEYFNSYLNDDFAKVVKRNGYSRIIIGSQNALKVCRLLYEESSVYLDRKYNNYLKFQVSNKNYYNIRQRKSGKYSAYIKVDYRQKSLGAYETVKEAVEAYNKEAIKLGRKTQEYVGESLEKAAEAVL